MNQFERQHIERMIKEIKQKGEIPIVKQAYYLYQNLGNIYQYKSNYKYLNYNTEEEMQTKKKVYDEGTTEDGKVICIDVNKTYVEALKMLGIEAHLSSFGKKLPHVDSCFKDEEGNWYYTDLTADIMHIKTGMKIRNFGLSEQKIIEKGKRKRLEPIYLRYIEAMKQENEGKEFTEIKEETLKLWDEEFGYSYQGLYTNDVLDMLLTEVQKEEWVADFFGTDQKDELAQRKIDFIMEKIEIANIHRRKKIGEVEAISYYTKVINKVLTEEERKYIKLCRAFIEENGVRTASDILAVEMQNENVYYWYNGESQIFEKITREELLKSEIKCHSRKEDKEDISVFINYLEERFSREKTEDIEK